MLRNGSGELSGTSVMLWDRGTWESDDPEAGFEQGKADVEDLVWPNAAQYRHQRALLEEILQLPSCDHHKNSARAFAPDRKAISPSISIEALPASVRPAA